MMLDIAPTLGMFEKTDQELATKYWHWFFLIQPSPFPENLILNNPEAFKVPFFGGSYAGQKGFMDAEALNEYVAQFKDEAGVHAMCEDYRAAATIDLVEQREDREAGRKIKCPVKVLWGKPGLIEKKFDCLAEWRAVCENEVSGEAVDSGHYIPEEVPDALLKYAREFFG
jgi:haloacetate dehalogenase